MPTATRNLRIVRLCALCAFLSMLAAPLGAQTPAPATYAIDAGSEIHWRIYKAGAFARFGHNHVIAVPYPSGRIVLADTLPDSRVELVFRADALVIDDPELRARYGEDFASVPTAEDISGTRGNMLGEDVLNAESFPEIHIVGTGLSGTGTGQSIRLTITLLGHEVATTVPVDITIDGDTISAGGDFRLTHEDLGMTPFSVMMGALQVAPEIDFTYRIHATRID